MSKYVVDGDWLLEKLMPFIPFGCVDAEYIPLMCNMRPDVIHPLTPAQERAGDEEEWRVVRKDVLEGLILEDIHRGDEIDRFIDPDAPRKSSTSKEFPEWMDYLTTPDSEKGGEKDE